MLLVAVLAEAAVVFAQASIRSGRPARGATFLTPFAPSGD